MKKIIVFALLMSFVFALASCTNVSGDDAGTATGELGLLKERYPDYFGLPVSDGLAVYVWQPAEESYLCGLLPGADREYEAEELWKLEPATLEDMRKIVDSYNLPEYKVSVRAVQMPVSSYVYTIDDEYVSKLKTLFWSEFETVRWSYAGSIIDSATFDIDGDGREEECNLCIGPTSGLNTFRLYVWDFTGSHGRLEYFNIFHILRGNLVSFAESDDGYKLRVDNGKDYDLCVKQENIFPRGSEGTIEYFGEQGVKSPYA